MQPINSSNGLIYAGIALLMFWRLYSRIRRLVGRQAFSNRRAWATVILLPTLLTLIALGEMFSLHSAFALVCGLTAGVLLGNFGLRKTKFEWGGAGYFYTPNVQLGISLFLLLVARIGYRVFQLVTGAVGDAEHPQTFLVSPLTLVVLGTTAGYYVRYAVGLMQWHRRVEAAVAEPV